MAVKLNEDKEMVKIISINPGMKIKNKRRIGK